MMATLSRDCLLTGSRKLSTTTDGNWLSCLPAKLLLAVVNTVNLGSLRRVRVTVTLRLAVYRQSVRLGAEPLEAHYKSYFCNWTFAVIVLVWHPLWREDGSVSYEYAWPLSSVRMVHTAYYWKFSLLHYIQILSVQALQSRSCPS
jgi:hypothetical protein